MTTAVVGSLLVAPATAASAAQPKSNSCADEQPDANAARRMLAVCGRRVEDLSKRTEWSQTFLNVDGSETLEQTIEPTRVRKGQSWVPVDTTLKVTPEGVVPKATILPMVFNSKGGDGAFARLRDGSRELAVSWPGKLPAPVIEGSTATYREVLPDVDLQVTAQPLGFSEVLVVRSRAAAANPKLASLRFGLQAKGVSVGAASGGGLAARDSKGGTVFAAPAPLMWDSSTPEDMAGGAPEKDKKGERSAEPQRKPTTKAEADAASGSAGPPKRRPTGLGAGGGPPGRDAGPSRRRRTDTHPRQGDAGRPADEATHLHRPVVDRRYREQRVDLGVEQVQVELVLAELVRVE